MQARLEGIKSIDLTKFLKHVNLYDNDLPDKFKKNFVNWISNSKLNTIEGLDKFNSISLSNGSIQIFDHFYLQYYEKRFRFFKGEFMYHKAVCKHKLNYKFIEDDYINSYDAFIISVPYTRKGKIHPDMFGILDKCEELQIPVLLDFAHLPIVKRLTRMPVCIDPSHSVGTREKSPDGIMDIIHSTSQGIIAGANMVLVDFHPLPTEALVDGPQALTLNELPEFIQDTIVSREAYEKRVAIWKEN